MYGNTLEAIARCHSGASYLNNRYQLLVSKNLMRSNALAGVIQAVPPIENNQLNTAR